MTVHRAANMAYQLGGDAQLLRRLADGWTDDDGTRHAAADVLELVECRTRDNQPLDVAEILGPGWDVRQDLRSADRAGSVVAVRRRSGVRIVWSRLQLASRASRAGAGVQDRYRRASVLVDHRGPFRLGVQHDPLRSTGRQDDARRSSLAWVRRARRAMSRRAAAAVRRLPLRWMYVGDPNRPHHAVRAELGAPHSHGADVMTRVWSAGWGRARVSADRLSGTDHHVLTFTS
ncbi:hypothetical protein QWY28_17425 [Nocardioides sp. SOB77]|uniref:Uncharacterized protein n=1 Tax=Nocardioides oceani TaxID=3058369 RepID=A0ABT8FJQ4_9ACTN|nr:hypothetical protein [Nocardioides oceani]MDN4174746.1 hypothetical protein [Nocardioides oceani]